MTIYSWQILSTWEGGRSYRDHNLKEFGEEVLSFFPDLELGTS